MFAERLQEVRERIPGARVLTLVAKDGMPVESNRDGSEVDTEMLSAEMMTQLRDISQNHHELDAGGVLHLAITTERAVLMVSALSDDYYLLLVTDANTNQGRARFELRRAALLFEHDIT